MLQIFAQPIYEWLDLKFCKLDQRIWSPWNILARCLTRAIYAALTAFFAALLPFFNDFLVQSRIGVFLADSPHCLLCCPSAFLE